MFKKGAFELGALVHPIAIKYKYAAMSMAQVKVKIVQEYAMNILR
jgi:hypothetical protein